MAVLLIVCFVMNHHPALESSHVSIPVSVVRRVSHFPAPLVQLCHMPPRKPGALFCSAKLALRAAAEASCDLRFCSWRPANLLTEDCGWYGYQRFYHFLYLEIRSVEEPCGQWTSGRRKESWCVWMDEDNRGAGTTEKLGEKFR